jgi:hypothetical protein
VPDADEVDEEVAVADSVDVAVELDVAVAVPVAEAVPVRDVVAVADNVGDDVRVAVAVAVDVPVAVTVPLPVAVALPVPVAVAEAVPVRVAVADGVPLRLGVSLLVGDAEGVSLTDGQPARNVPSVTPVRHVLSSRSKSTDPSAHSSGAGPYSSLSDRSTRLQSQGRVCVWGAGVCGGGGGWGEVKDPYPETARTRRAVEAQGGGRRGRAGKKVAGGDRNKCMRDWEQ